ncbi:MAG TPA: bifunctional proline dehydrogenase/L-glutamate gamma-semialdehyde dehydrogenase PutA [Rhodocyclaceae bacterium]|nr:bifunctional proline dehydrogenase/L-glutamate gamma-semialdehyde dehydrogenase PutA [Rhodocyclaceae bacterium]
MSTSRSVPPPDKCTLRDAVTRAYRRAETLCVAALVEELQSRAPDPQQVRQVARRLVQAVRQQRRQASGVDHLMHEFSLSSQEGVALMCLAEALLRIPDTRTADLLIRNKLGHGDWRAHLGHSSSLFVNAATWGLMLTGKLVSTHSDTALGAALTRVIGKGGEPLIRKGVEFAMQLLGQQFVAGETISSALARSEPEAIRGYTHSFDMLGEAALTQADATRYFKAYEAAIHAIGKASAGRGVVAGPGISVKLSALHPRYTRSQRGRVMDELFPALLALVRLARQYDIGLNIDAEEADRLDLSLDLITALIEHPELGDWRGLGVVVQAYQKRSPFVIDYLVHVAHAQQRRIMVRLVKGAYWDSEIKRAQVDGLPDYPVYTRKQHTDLSYLACAARLLDASEVIYPQFATHNAHTLAAVQQMAIERQVGEYEFQCLHGMGESLYDNIVGSRSPAQRCRIYAPVGSHETLLPYLVRRLLENGANSSFVNRIVNEQVSIDELIRDPLAQVVEEGGHAHPLIPLPPDLYGSARKNSCGLDLSDESAIAALDDELARWQKHQWSARPLLAMTQPHEDRLRSHSSGPGLNDDTGAINSFSSTLLNPANSRDCVGQVHEASIVQTDIALDIAERNASAWHTTPTATRARILRDAADLLETHRVELIALCIREAGKTRANAVAEIREAVDFCRYYAQQLDALDGSLPGNAPGPVVCISPWNFPLAIFMGQVTAALAAGSPVIAKPAEQTPLIAARAVELLHLAGVPATALQLLPGRGESVGAALTADPRVRGVVFTGSTEVAQLIHRSLAQHGNTADLRLIAETGGQNAMVVDSSALLEQVVQDVISSGFDSAGQRCSALRVLCVQHEVADRLFAMLRQAMRELSIGDPAHFATDVGPVIDAEARARLNAHIDSMRQRGMPVLQLALPDHCATGHFVPPTLIEINTFSNLPQEVFGPVVHLLRYDARELDTLIDAINASGYGLTFGVHSRIDETIARATQRIHAGNIYVNRNMVGAVVGVQPFGGEGLSGTGPKAGGPLYLHRLLETPVLTPTQLGLEPDAAMRGASPDALAELESWAEQQERHELINTCAACRANSLLHHSIALAGPTGERNTLHFAPRGLVLCIADTSEALLEQICAVFATGNTPLLAHNKAAVSLCKQLPATLLARLEVNGSPGTHRLTAVLHAGSVSDMHQTRLALAARNGALVPLLARQATRPYYPLPRLLIERVLSVNTAAAGGNPSLMTLGS